MPKKTKKEKLLAEYHRKLKLLQLQTTIKNTEQQTMIINSETPKEKQSLKAENGDKISPLPKEVTIPSYFLTDLKKSLFLSAIIIIFEISLYFVRIVK